jgi:hypothetical protein
MGACLCGDCFPGSGPGTAALLAMTAWGARTVGQSFGRLVLLANDLPEPRLAWCRHTGRGWQGLVTQAVLTVRSARVQNSSRRRCGERRRAAEAAYLRANGDRRTASAALRRSPHFLRDEFCGIAIRHCRHDLLAPCVSLPEAARLRQEAISHRLSVLYNIRRLKDDRHTDSGNVVMPTQAGMTGAVVPMSQSFGHLVSGARIGDARRGRSPLSSREAERGGNPRMGAHLWGDCFPGSGPGTAALLAMTAWGARTVRNQMTAWAAHTVRNQVTVWEARTVHNQITAWQHAP